MVRILFKHLTASHGAACRLLSNKYYFFFKKKAVFINGRCFLHFCTNYVFF